MTEQKQAGRVARVRAWLGRQRDAALRWLGVQPYRDAVAGAAEIARTFTREVVESETRMSGRWLALDERVTRREAIVDDRLGQGFARDGALSDRLVERERAAQAVAVRLGDLSHALDRVAENATANLAVARAAIEAKVAEIETEFGSHRRWAVEIVGTLNDTDKAQGDLYDRLSADLVALTERVDRIGKASGKNAETLRGALVELRDSANAEFARVAEATGVAATEAVRVAALVDAIVDGIGAMRPPIRALILRNHAAKIGAHNARIAELARQQEAATRLAAVPHAEGCTTNAETGPDATCPRCRLVATITEHGLDAALEQAKADGLDLGVDDVEPAPELPAIEASPLLGPDGAPIAHDGTSGPVIVVPS